jgi:hypothetical protein
LIQLLNSVHSELKMRQIREFLHQNSLICEGRET